MILWNLLSCAWSTPTPVLALALPSEDPSDDFIVLCDTGDTDDTDTDPPDPPPPPPEPVRPSE
jgi:hypothetical protein